MGNCCEGCKKCIADIKYDKGVKDWGKVDAKFQANFGFQRPDIRHMVVLLLENRTFDNVCGHFQNERYKQGEVQRSMWDTDDKDLYAYSNMAGDDNTKFPVWSQRLDDPEMFSEDNMAIPSGDPVEKFHLLNICLFGKSRPTKEDVAAGPTLSGFAETYYRKEVANAAYEEQQRIEKNEPEDPHKEAKQIPGVYTTDFERRRSPAMHVYLKQQVPVFTEIMTHFGCSDTYFASCPMQTWPNRLFAVCATAYGYYNNIARTPLTEDEQETSWILGAEEASGTLERLMTSYNRDTVFHRLEKHGVSWGIYKGDVSLAAITTTVMTHFSVKDRVKAMDEFYDDIKADKLPNYSFLEPKYTEMGGTPPNDMHPPHNVLYAQKFVRDLYVALKTNRKVWEKTLFVITCDEGVGIFDHVGPPRAKDPVDGHDHTYHFQGDGGPADMVAKGGENPFERYGTRVPALFISPWVKPGQVLRPFGAENGEAMYPFCHGSLIRTAFDLLTGDKTEHLTQRDEVAPSFVHALSDCRNDGPTDIQVPAFGDPPPHRLRSNMPPRMQERHAQCHGVDSLKGMLQNPKAEGKQLKSSMATKMLGMLGI